MKKFNKFLKAIILTSFILFAIAISGGVIFYHSITHSLSLDHEKFNQTKAVNFSILDENGQTISNNKINYIKITKLSSDTKNAFICAEDKRFYTHSGLDYIRMGKAILSNIKSKSFSQGASTISKQLIKNTQLTNEKTLTRKLKEIKLTKELENNYSKDEILEFYLNNIYFGNGCYGIENAAWHYFSKSATNLSLSESATLAATINAPSFYDPENNLENVTKRRNLILNLMQKENKIDEIQCKNAQNEEILLKIQNLKTNTFLANEVIKEACEILNSTPNNIANKNIKIYTKLNLNTISSIKNLQEKNYSNLPSRPNIATIIIDNKTNQIISLTGEKDAIYSKKQPGSTIKPILVYAPAIENNLISPATKILDEPINFSGYSPHNSNGKYHGYVSVRESLKNSYNIPAVKTLNELGISKAQDFAKNLGIEFHKNDNNLAIALGGFTDGITLKSLADAYVTFANNGVFAKSQFISKITQDNKTIYTHNPIKKEVMKDSTAYLITNMLLDTSKTGTAKRLKDFEYEVASKTGTVGGQNSSINKESFNICYTTNHTILTYFGGTSMSEQINGSTYPTMFAKDILCEIYKTKKPQNFSIPKSTTKIFLDKNAYENNILTKTTDKNSNIVEIFASDNIPKNSITPSFELKAYNFENKKPILEFETNQNYKYEIIRKKKNEEEIISSSSNDNFVKFEDLTAKSSQIYEYYIKFYNQENLLFESNHITLKSF